VPYNKDKSYYRLQREASSLQEDTMKPVDASPLPTLCCELNPLMATSGKRIYQEDGLPTYVELTPLLCRFCGCKVCEECWKSGKHFVKNFVAGEEEDVYGWKPLLEVKREMPSCINPWHNMLLRTKASL
jgi:hypothetical protein